MMLLLAVTLLLAVSAQQGSGCEDANPRGCAQWVPAGFCADGRYKSFLMTNCKKSCDFCTWNGYCESGGPDHTMCQYTGVDTSQCTGLFARESLTSADKKVFLDAHNTLRRKVADGDQAGLPAATQPMPDLVWDETLAEVAQRWIDQCQWEHDKNRITEQFQTNVGQNLYMTKTKGSGQPTDKPWKKAVDAWYSEVDDYVKANGNVKSFQTIDGVMI